MNTKVRIILMFTVLSFFLMFPSCTEKTVELQKEDITEAIESAVPLDEGYYSASEQYFLYYFKDDEGNRLPVSDWGIYRSNSQSSENEFGIIVAQNGEIAAVKSACEHYIEARRESYLEAKAAYSPEEYEKYRDAEIKVYGNTVVYLIMTKEDSERALNKIDALNK